MAELSVNMLHRAVGAFLNRDADIARLIPGEDDLVDALYNRVFIDLVNVMLEDPSQETIQQANYLMWAAHNLERLSDRVTNICERVVYVSTGEVKELDTIDRIELAKDLPSYG
jgi:phosphate transport system protein